MTTGISNISFKPASRLQNLSRNRNNTVGFSSETPEISDSFENKNDKKEIIIACAGPAALSALAGTLVGLAVNRIPKSKPILPAIVAGVVTAGITSLLTIPGEISRINASKLANKMYRIKSRYHNKDKDKLSEALDKNLNF